MRDAVRMQGVALALLVAIAAACLAVAPSAWAQQEGGVAQAAADTSEQSAVSGDSKEAETLGADDAVDAEDDSAPLDGGAQVSDDQVQSVAASQAASQKQEAASKDAQKTASADEEAVVDEGDGASTKPETVDAPHKDGWEAGPNGAKYYYRNGKKLSGEATIDGKRYYFDPAADNAMKTGWADVPVSGGKTKRAYFASDGHMLTGQQCISKSWYYFDPSSGAMATGFVWVKDQNKWVCYGSDGKMLYGQQFVNGHWYLFDGVTGAVTYGFVYIEDQSKWVFYDQVMGWMLYGEQCINDHWYLFDATTGAVTYGFAYIEGQNKWVFYDRTMGWMLYGEQCIDNGWYYLTPGTGAVDYEWAWLPQSKKWVYYDPITGRMQYGTKKIDGKWYVLDKVSGARNDGASLFANRAQRYSSSTPWLLLIDTNACRFAACKRVGDHWEVAKYLICSPGKDSTPTIKGEYTLGMKGYSFGSGFTCYYWSQIQGDYLIHSLMYQEGTFNLMENTLGQKASHGCVRLDINEAKWVYNTIPQGTKIGIW